MPNINDMKNSRFLKRQDVGDGVVVTIVGVELTNVALESGPKDEKWCAVLREFPGKLMVLNGTNQRMIAKVLDTEETDEWVGRKIVLWDDESVEFKGQVVGGIRVKRAPGKVAKAPTVNDANEDAGEEAPF